MSYLFKQTITDNKIVYEVKIINYCIFIVLVLLSLIPAIAILENYNININVFRIFYVGLVLIVYASLGGNVIIKLWNAKKMIRTGKIFSKKNPLTFTIDK